MGRFGGKVAAVTGGASGIGEATVRRFVEEGARVAFADRDGERGARVLREIEASGGEVLFVDARMENASAASAFVERTVDSFGRLDVLVNNAAIRLFQTVAEASEESWDFILGINLKGYAFCAKAAIPLMLRTGGGSIVNVTSGRAVKAQGDMVQYDTTKAAILGLTRGMARDHAAEGIRVNAIAPGPIFTLFHEERARAAGKTFEEYRADFGRGTMLGRPGEPGEVADAILYLASDEASYITGTCLFVDGGLTAQ